MHAKQSTASTRRDAFAANTYVSLSTKGSASTELNELEVEDANLSWIPRQRAVVSQVVRYLEKSEEIRVEISELVQSPLGTEDADISIRSIAETPGTRKVTADSCCSTRLKAKEKVEALRWLMELFHGLHGREWSYAGWKRTTPSIRRTRGEWHQ